MKDYFKDKKILITGGCGYIGSHITKELLKHYPEVIRVLDNNEYELFRMKHQYRSRDDMRFLLGDIRDKQRLDMAMENIDIVFHTAALKHVPVCEYDPLEAIKTNILGTENVIESSIKAEVSKVMNISTDKAVNPGSTMGATKLLCEKLMVNANYFKGLKKPVFCNVRFGNVLMSRGSVIPFFEQQIKEEHQVDVTCDAMTRFIMSIDDVTSLILRATSFCHGGEIFILKMPAIRLGDLVDVCVDYYGVKHSVAHVKRNHIGLRAGEKLHEELLSDADGDYIYENEELLLIPPHVYPFEPFTVEPELKMSRKPLERYRSNEVRLLSNCEIRKIILENEENG
jgi:FlaA1/EpsC-like NDP-sugar epimerase